MSLSYSDTFMFLFCAFSGLAAFDADIGHRRNIALNLFCCSAFWKYLIWNIGILKYELHNGLLSQWHLYQPVKPLNNKSEIDMPFNWAFRSVTSSKRRYICWNVTIRVTAHNTHSLYSWKPIKYNQFALHSTSENRWKRNHEITFQVFIYLYSGLLLTLQISLLWLSDSLFR
jgi:hypothetical protein